MSDPFVDVMGPLGVLRTRVEETFAEHGLRVVHVGIVPGADLEGPHEVQILAILADEPPGADDKEFMQLLKASRDAELDQRAAEARNDLQRQMKNPDGGIL